MSDSARPASPTEQTAVSQETAFVLDADEARLLTEVGMLAARAGDLARADAIFNGLRAVRPGRAYPYIGLALARIARGRADEAVQLLEHAVLADDAERAQAQAWRGLALQLAGRAAESRKVLQDAAAQPNEGGALARSLLGLGEDAARMPAGLAPTVKE
ncbi:Flp pilus assembly protein TadD%2C contains TPR repeats [Bordetella ansorpii]|uniref:Flp pilus assembly protein TadD, contains TPR repeats n=1 Tax=Bordetella ansorpii TaxID=288768 RepID=A0A157SIH0_9BORD|nr:hypothetical protein [Bordetella ansorpii]SAI69983.1 Flp pilus assembly protein TadD%2C contains TPR repeats [Bordetella ansorpii]